MRPPPALMITDADIDGATRASARDVLHRERHIIDTAVPCTAASRSIPHWALVASSSMPSFTLKTMDTPKSVHQAMLGIEAPRKRSFDPINAAAAQAAREARRCKAAQPFRCTPPAPSHRQAPRRRRTPHLSDDSPTGAALHSVASVTSIAPRTPQPPPPAPLDRMYSRRVQCQLDKIEGSATPLRERLFINPGFANLNVENQNELRRLVGASNPRLYNVANAPALEGKSLREVIQELDLRAASSVRVEISHFHRKLLLHERVSQLKAGRRAVGA
jgi:hypothetical protein